MHNKHWLGLILAGFLWAAFLAAPGLPLPGADRLGISGTAAAQETIDIDTFYGELAPRALVDRVAQINSRRATVI
jgi:hypothetical protein